MPKTAENPKTSSDVRYSGDWIPGVKIVDKEPQGFCELAFVRKINSRNAVVLEEVLYQAKDETGVKRYWAKSVRDPDRKHHTINAQARLADYLKPFRLRGIWEPKHYLEIEPDYGKPYKIILSEKLPSGKTLFQRIYDAGDKGLSSKRALDIIHKVSQIVQQLHDLHVFHWDISSKNIWLTDWDETILFDWDFAFKDVQEFLERKLWRCGTPHYLSQGRLAAMELGYDTLDCHLELSSFAAHEVYSLISVLAHMLMGNQFLKYGNHFGLPYNEHASLGKNLSNGIIDCEGISEGLRGMLVKTFRSGKSPFETVADFLKAMNTLWL